MDQIKSSMQLTAGLGNKSKAILVLYTPRNYSTQVLRPYMYGFSESFTGKLLDSPDQKMSSGLDRIDVAKTDSVAGAIRPETNGIGIDMSMFNQFWTFVLMIYKNNEHPDIFATEGGRVTIISGYCMDEPIAQTSMWDPNHYITNQQCRLVVQRREVVGSSIEGNQVLGLRSATDVMCTEDIVNESLNMMASNHDLYRMTPCDVLSHYQLGGEVGGSISAPGMCSLPTLARDKNSKEGVRNIPITTGYKSPGAHLKGILQSLDLQIARSQQDQWSPRSISDFTAVTDAFDVDNFKNGVIRALSNNEGAAAIQTGNIDILGGLTLGDIEREYPSCQVHVTKFQSKDAQFEVTPQTLMSDQIAYSSMVGSAVSAIAADCGLGSISFQYQFYHPMHRGELDKSHFQCVPDSVTLTCQPAIPTDYNNILKAAVQQFRYRIHHELAPYIAGIHGNFCMQVMYANCAETAVHLDFLDNDVSKKFSGFVETPMRIASLGSTSLGGEGHFEANAHALNALVLGTQGRTDISAMTGLPAFESGETVKSPMFKSVGV